MSGAPVSKSRVIADYVPGCLNQGCGHGIQRVGLQLFGLLGHGKSALINSCLCVLSTGGRYHNAALSAPTAGGLTTRREEYALSPRLVLLDNRGLRHMTAAEMLECSAQFRQLRELGEVTWTGISIREASKVIAQGAGTEPTDVLVPVFVWSCKTNLNSADLAEIGNLFQKAHNITGIHPIVVLTHSSRNPQVFINKFQNFQATHFFCLENYTQVNHQPNPETDKTIVDFVYCCLIEAEERIKNLAREDPSSRVIRQTTAQVQEEARVLKESLDRMKSALKM